MYSNYKLIISAAPFKTIWNVQWSWQSPGRICLEMLCCLSSSILVNILTASICSFKGPKICSYLTRPEPFILFTMLWQFMNECLWSSLVGQSKTHCTLFLCNFLKLAFELWHFDLNKYNNCFCSWFSRFVVKYGCSLNSL